jgi:hypothetical protein
MEGYLQHFLATLDKGFAQITYPVERLIHQGRDKWLLLYFHVALEADTPILEALFHSGTPFAPNRWEERPSLQGKDAVFFFGCEPVVLQYLAGGRFECREGFSDAGYAPGFGVAGEMTEQLVPVYPPELVQHLSQPSETLPFSSLRSVSGEIFVHVPRLASNGASISHAASSAAAAVVLQEALLLCRTARFVLNVGTNAQPRLDIVSLFDQDIFCPHAMAFSDGIWSVPP